jgi:hypothetical protein
MRARGNLFEPHETSSKSYSNILNIENFSNISILFEDIFREIEVFSKIARLYIIQYTLLENLRIF